MKYNLKFSFIICLFITLIVHCKNEDTVNLNQSRYILAQNGLLLRDHPSIESKIITKIPFNEKVFATKKLNSDNIDGINDNWLEVEYKNYKGFIFGGYTSLYSLSLNKEYKVNSNGTIGPKKEEFLGERLHFPKNTQINAYNKNQKKIGIIEKGEGYTVVFIDKNSTKSSVKSTMIGYDGIGIEIFEINERQGKIFLEDLNIYYWVNLEDFEPHELMYYSWVEFFNKFDISLFAVDTILLKEEPDENSKTIVKINDLRYTLSMTGKQKGIWSEVKIQKYFDQKGIFGNFPKPTNEYKGWIKILDNKGSPNVWFYAKGC